jgi:hypothetical protein
VGFNPQRSRCFDWIETEFMPPPSFIPVTMEFTMMSLAQWDGELVSDFAPERTALRKPKTMGVARLTTANQAGLLAGSPFFVVSSAADLI